MTRVVITGAGSYIGTHLLAHLSQHGYDVREVDVRTGLDETSLANCDVVIHVAGIAHQRETKENAPLYRQVNRDLAVQTARAAKAQGVRQFVFFSSMSVYGVNTGRITMDTQPAPTTCYGTSKWEAEQELAALADEHFRIAVLRPPMIYGRGCRGNYPRLAAMAKSLPVFPKTKNQRSMLYIGTLCDFVQSLIESGCGGLYFPQNREYVNTAEMVQCIALCAKGRRIRLMPGFGGLLRMLESRVGLVGKVFGTLTYDQQMSQAFRSADELSFSQTIRQTEVGQ